jgi:hypothetical protein
VRAQQTAEIEALAAQRSRNRWNRLGLWFLISISLILTVFRAAEIYADGLTFWRAFATIAPFAMAFILWRKLNEYRDGSNA